MKHVTHAHYVLINAEADAVGECYAGSVKVEPLRPRGKVSVEGHLYEFGDSHVWSCHCQTGMKIIPDRAMDCYALFLSLSGAMEVNSGARNFSSGPQQTVVHDMSRFDAMMLGENRNHIGIVFSRSAMTRQLSELLQAPVLNSLEFNGHIDLTTGAGRRLAALGDLIYDSAGACETAVRGEILQKLFEATMMVLLETVPNNYTAKLQRPVSSAAPRHLKRAIEYMHHNVASPISISDIAKYCGTSARALQIAFQTFKHTTPTNYLRTIRLAGVREALQLNENRLPIAEIARAWGFSHMGHFSASYLQAFGESPSDTLRNRIVVSAYQAKDR